jgi:site-specific DNA-cytosine methylase
MNELKVLIACEESQAVCIEFRKRGHEAYSCDVQECSGGHPEWHIQEDVLKVIEREHWDMMIAFPPCTHLAVSGARYFEEKRKDGRQQEGIDFFMKLTKINIPKWAIENPVGIMSNVYRKPNQIIQPWMFGHGETKATCLWLRGLPRLNGFNVVEGREQRIWKLPPSESRSKERSKTFPGIAKAMAEQWSDNLKNTQYENIHNSNLSFGF